MAALRAVLFVLAVSVFVAPTACARQLTSSSSWLSYWQQKLPTVQVPKSLPPLASTLSSAETSVYVQELLSGSVDGQAFCEANNMLCAEKASGPVACLDTNLYGHARCEGRTAAASAAVLPGVFFDPSMLSVGNKFVYPKISNDVQGRTFLPDALAKAMSFSKDKLSEEYVVLDVPSDSNMAQNMQQTLSFCESAPPKGEIRTCHSSIESMVDFGASNLGTELVVLSPEYTSTQSEQVTISSNPVLLSGPEQFTMSCHNLMYPYLVYGCHVMGSSQILDVQLEMESGSGFHGIAVCHTDTSSWNEDHPAFAALGMKPGESSVCHWVRQNNFVWITAKYKTAS